MTSEVVESIVEDGATALGSFPAAYQNLVRVLANPASNAEHITAAVRVDPVLTARLLAFVNGAHLGRRIKTIAHASMIIGRRQLHGLATASAVIHMFRGIPEHLVDMDAFWRHSMAVALAANQLGLVAPGHVTGLFVPAILHDIGALLIYLVRPGDARRILIDTENHDTEARLVEHTHLGADHAELGAQLLSLWGLPERATTVARFHHEPGRAPAAFRREVDLVHLADVAVSALQIGNAGERGAHSLDEAAWEGSGLQPDQVLRCLDGLTAQVDEIAAALGA